MAGINWESILKKAQHCMERPDKKRQVQTKVDDYMFSRVGFSFGTSRNTTKPPSMAAGKFIEVLRAEIVRHADGDRSAGGLGPSSIAGLSKLNSGEPYKVGDKYYIDVYFDEDLSRPSLAPDRYDGIDNIAALLNSGYTAGHRVYGVWEKHGDERIASMVRRGGAHFIEQAISDFMGNYAAEYGVLDIEVSDIYK